MLSPPDAAIVKRDPALPGLATLLDPEALAEALNRRFPDWSVRDAAVSYVRYKPGTSCLVAFHLDLGSMTREGYAIARGEETAGKLRDALRKPPPVEAPGPPRTQLDDRETLCLFFPDDERLTVLPRLVDPESRRRLLAKLLPEQPGIWDGSLLRLRYKPERRFVAGVQASTGEHIVLKAYTPADYELARINATRFDRAGGFCLAPVVGKSTRHRILAFAWLEGRSLADALKDPEWDVAELAPVGPALAALHAQGPSRFVAHRRRAEQVARLSALVGGLGMLLPEMAPRAKALAKQVAAAMREEPPVLSATHGDFYAGQVLLQGDGAAILDLDEAARGDPHADLGNFLAHLDYDAFREGGLPGRANAARSGFLTGYQQSREIHQPSLDLNEAAALLRLTHHPFRNREDRWPEHVEWLLDRAEMLLAGRARARADAGAGQRGSPPSIPVDDPFGAARDPSMPFLGAALGPEEAETQLRLALRGAGSPSDALSLRAIRVVRHKPGRRCLVEYDLERAPPNAESESFTLVGKARAKGLDRRTYRVCRALYEAGFSENGDGVAVPRPVGTIPAFEMWLQQKAPGVSAELLLAGPERVALAERIACAIHRLHSCDVPRSRPPHTIRDEMKILHERLMLLAHDQPRLAKRIDRVARACDRLAAAIPLPAKVRGIHRDFYADQLLVEGSRLYLLDLDLFCDGDPALDLGNFVGHVSEYSLRVLGNPAALRDVEETLVGAYLRLSDAVEPRAIDAYATLTLARLVHVSTQIAERRPFTEALLALSEQRLSLLP